MVPYWALPVGVKFTDTAPAADDAAAGTVQDADVLELTVQVALTEPNFQPDALVKPLPVTVTVPVPATGPLTTDSLLMTAAYLALVESAVPATPLLSSATLTAVLLGVPAGTVIQTWVESIHFSGAATPLTVPVIFSAANAVALAPRSTPVPLAVTLTT